ncbi:hypothetical protein BDN72DRAFT_760050 [Pluteus cervinus]|uniref:Uncharacterized protein n=1 Tax=Pluteus cervinus TaxID=181527 RepID=A0ACD3B7Z1_9AGAR|nr:hypothetical protein BDN72DRAFT_760050 [Pluteus cervinus]
MERPLADQEREIKDVVRRARNALDKSGNTRREAFKKLINLIHSPHPSLKIFAAGNIRYFFTDFPDLEETAINAVYDLCEDQSSQVRMEGYTAITHISTASNKWIKRNADVLLQLLQSDEPDEVVIVKKALCEHLDMDPKVTLGVLCDQVIPPSGTVDEEEQAIRDRLRALVIAFLTGEAKRAIVERHATPGSGAEEVLTRGLLEAIPRLPPSDVEIIIKDLLLSLPAYKHNSQAGTPLLRVLLNKASANLRLDLRAPKDVKLDNALPYINLAKLIVLQHPVASPTELLRFYFISVASKIPLQKLAPETQLAAICELIEVLAACENDSTSQGSQDLVSLRRQIVDACPYLLEVSFNCY